MSVPMPLHERHWKRRPISDCGVYWGKIRHRLFFLNQVYKEKLIQSYLSFG